MKGKVLELVLKVNKTGLTIINNLIYYNLSFKFLSKINTLKNIRKIKIKKKFEKMNKNEF
jgi:hypothetical protein